MIMLYYIALLVSQVERKSERSAVAKLKGFELPLGEEDGKEPQAAYKNYEKSLINHWQENRDLNHTTGKEINSTSNQ